MSNFPTSTKPEDHGIYYLGKVGQRTQMTRASNPPQQPPSLPPPSHILGERRQLPPLPSIQPLPSQYPQVQHHSIFLPERPSTAYGQPPPLTQSPAAQSASGWQPPAQQSQAGPVSSFTHPALFPQKASFQSRNPGTVYEALSPVEYSTHEQGGLSSLFTEASYHQSPYQTAPLSVYHTQSPASSHQSSNTSSSGAQSGRDSALNPQFAPAAPPPKSSSPKVLNEMVGRYVLTIRQQPIAARACGFGERDRRVIDPPPIVQLSLRDFNPNSAPDVAELHYAFNIVHCTLLSASPQQQHPTSAPALPLSPTTSDVTAVPDPNQNNRLSRRLMGTLVASPFLGRDPEVLSSAAEYGSLATFYIFPDLSCRQNGLYRLRFTLMKVPMGPNMVEGGQGSLCGSVDSDVFEVFSAKDFPGMRPSTLLTKDLKRQGAGVSVKKGKAPPSAGNGYGMMMKEKRGDGEDGSADEAEREVKGKGRPRKRRG